MAKNTKQRLFMAAFKAFANKGYQFATVREICKIAGEANINAVNYYFGSKEKLYQKVLEFIFDLFSKKHKYKLFLNQPPEKALKNYIRSYCDMLFGEREEIDLYMTSIFLREISNPSPFLDEMVSRFYVPERDSLIEILRDFLDQKAPENVLMECANSIIGQISYYLNYWPVILKFNPEHPKMPVYYERLAEHITQFSLAGLGAIKQSLYEEKSLNRAKRVKSAQG